MGNRCRPRRTSRFLIPTAGNQLLRSRAGSVSIYACVGGSALRGGRLDGQRRDPKSAPFGSKLAQEGWDQLEHVCNTAGSSRGTMPIQAHLSWGPLQYPLRYSFNGLLLWRAPDGVSDCFHIRRALPMLFDVGPCFFQIPRAAPAKVGNRHGRRAGCTERTMEIDRMVGGEQMVQGANTFREFLPKVSGIEIPHWDSA